MKNLNLKYKLTLPINGSLNLQQTLFCGQCFRWRQYDDNTFFAVVNGRVIYANVVASGLILQSNLPLCSTYWQHYFALDENYAEMQSRLCEDPVLQKCVNYANGIIVLHQDFFETLITFIISQNNNIPRITAIVERLCQYFGDLIEENSYSFPTAQKLAALSLQDLEPLRAGFRAKYILDAACRVASGEINEDALRGLDIQHAAELLKKIKGVGPKVADCVLLFGLDFSDAFPKDVWINRAMQMLFPNGLPPQANGIAGIAQQYIFKYAHDML